MYINIEIEILSVHNDHHIDHTHIYKHTRTATSIDLGGVCVAFKWVVVKMEDQ